MGMNMDVDVDAHALKDLNGDVKLAVGMAKLQAIIHGMARAKGWWEPPKTFGEQLLMLHSEVSEALEEYRKENGTTNEVYYVDGKPEGVPIELADVVIRIMDTCERYQIDLLDAILTKVMYNMDRPHRHGNKKL